LINLDCKAKILTLEEKTKVYAWFVCLGNLSINCPFQIISSTLQKKNSFQLSGVKRNENEKQFESAFDINGTKRFVELRKETKQNKDRKMRT
jgi:hypothetical protein